VLQTSDDGMEQLQRILMRHTDTGNCCGG